MKNDGSKSRNVASAPEPGVAGAQTLLRALDILECFVEDGTPIAPSEISRRVALTQPTTYRLVKALESRSYLLADADRRYSLGPAVMRLASVVMHRADDLIAVATPALERLRDTTGETASLHCPLGDDRICVAELVSLEAIRMESGVGRIYPMYAGAAGKAMLAWLPALERKLRARLVSVGPSTITDPTALESDLGRIRKRGYAASDSEVVPGASSIAVPVFSGTGDVVAALNVAGPTSRWSRTKSASIREAALREADRLMSQIASTRASTGSHPRGRV
jgi:DNA-binding IclR family transcriptional regulator